MLDGRWRHAVDRTTEPVGSALVRIGVTADVLTAVGLVMAGVNAWAIATGRLALAIGLLFATGLPDLFDGPVAKASGRASVRGAFFDSVSDRVADALLFGGVAWYLEVRHHGTMVLLPFAILAATQVVSYQRAKAELLGIPAKGGLMERAERFIFLGLCFIAGIFSPTAFVVTLAVFLGLVSATAAGRFVRVWQVAEAPPKPERPELARWREARADSRWRTWRETRAHRDGTRPVRPRRAGEPVGRWRARREAVPSTRTGRVWRDRVATRGRLRAGRHAGPSGY